MYILVLSIDKKKSFNARLAVDYPVYAMVICQVITCIVLCSAIFDRNDGYFRQLRLLAQHSARFNSDTETK